MGIDRGESVPYVGDEQANVSPTAAARHFPELSSDLFHKQHKTEVVCRCASMISVLGVKVVLVVVLVERGKSVEVVEVAKSNRKVDHTNVVKGAESTRIKCLSSCIKLET